MNPYHYMAVSVSLTLALLATTGCTTELSNLPDTSERPSKALAPDIQEPTSASRDQINIPSLEVPPGIVRHALHITSTRSDQESTPDTLHSDPMIQARVTQPSMVMALHMAKREDESSSVTAVEIDGIVTDFDRSKGTLDVEGIRIALCDTTAYRHHGREVDRKQFFARLRQGVSVVKVKWNPFTGYDQPPDILNLDT